MPEQKRRGFHALEQRIHEMEEEDAKREQEREAEAPRTEPKDKGETKRK